jgi:hypothetical protein
MTPAPKLHHYVPRMLVRRFSEAPAEENPRIACLDKATGSIRWSSVRNEAAVTDHDRLREVPEHDPELDPLAAEHILSVIEDAAAVALRRLDEYLPLGPRQLPDLAAFVLVQHGRTPRGRSWHRFVYEQTPTLAMMKSLIEAPASFVRKFLNEHGDDVTDEEAARWRESMISDLDEGRVSVGAGEDR